MVEGGRSTTRGATSVLRLRIRVREVDCSSAHATLAATLIDNGKMMHGSPVRAFWVVIHGLRSEYSVREVTPATQERVCRK